MVERERKVRVRQWDRDKRGSERGKQRCRLLERSYGCLNETKRGKETERIRKRKVRREWWSYKEKLSLTERRGRKPRLQHCKRQRCALPGGRSDNMYHGPPTTMSILRRQRRRDTSNPEREEKRKKEKKDRYSHTEKDRERECVCVYQSLGLNSPQALI